MSRHRRVPAWAAVMIVMLLVFWLLGAMLIPVGGGRTVTVRIPQGASAGAIGRILARDDVIRSSLGFRFLARITGKGSRLKPGAYRLNSSMSPVEALTKIANGDVSARWVTFPEGFTVKQIADRLAAEGLANEDRFLELALYGGSSFTTGFRHPGNSLEGYLFPDTYLIAPGTTEEAIIREMLACFERKVASPMSSDIARSGMSLRDLVTMASLIEREARVSKDRDLISGVLRNRLKRGMRLECDATVLYALGEHKSRVLYSDLEVESAYNTYRNVGLPPGPIANPGSACISAALHPADVDYLFYVARPDGSHIFSRTMAEHQRARQTARREAGR
jgi:UPF0755 protein